MKCLFTFVSDCPTSCKDVPYEPVCGSDKKIYSNKCKLKQAACLSNRNITVAPHQVCFNSELPIVVCSVYIHVHCGILCT